MVYLILFLIGAVLIPAGDIVHVMTKTTFYPAEQMAHTLFGIVPFWVPLLFGFGAVGAAVHTNVVRKWFPRKTPVGIDQVIVSGVAFMAMYILSGILPKTWITDAVLWASAFTLYVYAGEFSWGGILQCAGVMFGGTAFEIFLTRNDIFHYTSYHDQLFGVAPWLPLLYLGVAVGVDCIMTWHKRHS